MTQGAKVDKSADGETPRRMPGAVIFDLDYTSWGLWVDTHVTPPLKRRKDEVNVVYDRYGTAMSFYPDVPSIFLEMHHTNVYLAIASRTAGSDANDGRAKQALTELLIEGSHRNAAKDRLKAREGDSGAISAIRIFDQLEIYPGSKLKHLKAIHEKSGIAYEEMVFFDDEHRNREVEKLGVTFVLVGAEGVTRRAFEAGLEKWRNSRKDTA